MDRDQRPERSLTIVCSDCARNGKTLFAKLAADLLSLRHGEAPIIFDCDEPDGALVRQFRHTARVLDITKTTEQVAIFDGVLSADFRHGLIDLPARHLKSFFKVYEDIGFGAEARAKGVEITVFFVIDRAVQSVMMAANLCNRLEKVQFIPVRNMAIGDALSEGRTADIYHGMRFARDITLPSLSGEALGILEHPDFHFDLFIAGHYDNLPFEMRTELWAFMESLYEQRQTINDSGGSVV